MSSQRIVLIHATALSIAPISASFAQLWPDAEVTNILEDALSVDRAKHENLQPSIYDRISRLADYAMTLDPAAILFTCSAFGPAIEMAAARLPIPVLKPNEAMFEQALQYGGRIGLVTTFPASLVTLKEEFFSEAARRRPDAQLVPRFAAHAMDALRDGDRTRHNRLIADEVAAFSDVDAIMLGQFSMANALADSAARTKVPVLSSPDAAVRKLRSILAPHISSGF